MSEKGSLVRRGGKGGGGKMAFVAPGERAGGGCEAKRHPTGKKKKNVASYRIRTCAVRHHSITNVLTRNSSAAP